ncbi:MAG: ISKra4 family transposase, partial [Candidatus Competibacterales bacterium]
TNHLDQMAYAEANAKHWPIGSGVTEAACKTLVKQRLGRSGMRWKVPGADGVITLRALVMSDLRWSQFWSKLDRYGFPITL